MVNHRTDDARSAVEAIEQVGHVVGVLFLDRQDRFENPARGDILLAEIANDFSIRVDRNAFRDEILANHVDQIGAFLVLGMRA